MQLPLPHLNWSEHLRPLRTSDRTSDRLDRLDDFGSNPGQLNAWTFIPDKADDEQLPLVVVLHGSTQSAESYNNGSGWSALADECGVALLFPGQGSQQPNMLHTLPSSPAISAVLDESRSELTRLGLTADIDTAMTLGYRHPMGPLRLTDLVGLDVRLAIAEYLHAELGGERFRPPEILRRMVAEGRLGRKTGRGFFEWDDA